MLTALGRDIDEQQRLVFVFGQRDAGFGQLDLEPSANIRWCIVDIAYGLRVDV
jgi:hypothetical protein